MTVRILQGDCRDRLKELSDESVHMVVTSPPYLGQRDYGVEGQLGQEATPEEFVVAMVHVFQEVRRVLRKDGTLWLNLGDSYSTSGGAFKPNSSPLFKNRRAGKQAYAGSNRISSRTGLKRKDLLMMPERVAMALQADGWWLRSKIIWHKPNCMPESAKDRPTHSYDYIFLFSKSKRYFYDRDATAVPVSEATHARMSQDIEAQIGSARTYGGKRKNGNMKANVRGMTAAGGVNPKAIDRGSREHLKVKQNESFAESVAIRPTTRNDRDVWIIPAKGYTGAHFATFPPAIPERCILAGTSEKGCCPACGAPIRRITKATYINDTTVSGRPAEGNRKQEADGRENEVMDYDQRTRLVVTTVGWKATCEHVLAATGHPIPCTVLDPFGGAGTTGLVAARLHRNAILIELRPEYARMAERRIYDDAPLLADIRHGAPEVSVPAA